MRRFSNHRALIAADAARGLRTLAACGLSTALAAAGCSSGLPSSGGDRLNAVGTITMSPPLFRPIVGEDENTQIDFGDYMSVQSLWQELATGNLSTASLLLQQRSASVSAAVAGPSFDMTGKRTVTTADGKVTENTSSQTSTVSQVTPAVPAAAAAPTAGDAQAQLLAILAAGDGKSSLPPDVRASLVHSYRAYMQSIAAFANQANFIETTENGEAGWRPYRVQFVLTADPGWWTAHRDYDAIAHIRFGDGEDDKKHYQVMSVMPAETAQVVEDFQASLRSFAIALALSGQYGPAAGQAEFKNLEAIAERLEGHRINTNMIVSYPKPNEIRVRLRPSLTAVRDNQRDLQPTSRIMTAIVRVWEGGGSPGDNPLKLTLARGGETKGDATKQESARGASDEAQSNKQVAQETRVKEVGPSAAPTPQATNTADEDRSTNNAVQGHVKVRMIGMFIPGPRDRKSGKTDYTPRSQDAVYSTPRPDEDWALTRDKYKPEWNSVRVPHAQEISTTIPTWSVPKGSPSIGIAELTGAFHPAENGGTVTAAFSLKLPGDATNLRVEVAAPGTNNPLSVIGETGAARSAGVFTVAVPQPSGSATQVGVPVRFTVDVEGKAVTTARMLYVPIFKSPAAEQPNVRITGMPLEELKLRVGAPAAGGPSSVTTVPVAPSSGN
jgi:hypothetical protein